MKFFQLTTQIEELCNFQNSLTDKMTTPVSDPVKKHGKRKQVSENQKPSKVKKCEYCKNEWHTKVTCPLLKLKLQVYDIQRLVVSKKIHLMFYLQLLFFFYC